MVCTYNRLTGFEFAKCSDEKTFLHVFLFNLCACAAFLQPCLLVIAVIQSRIFHPCEVVRLTQVLHFYSICTLSLHATHDQSGLL